MPRKPRQPKQVTALKHDDAKRPNIPTAELQPVMPAVDQSPIRVAYARRNRDLDPQLVWSGKDRQDDDGLSVQAPPLFIQEKVHPQVLINDLMRTSGRGRVKRAEKDGADLSTDHSSLSTQIGFADLFADFNGLEGDAAAKTEFYQHDANWTNRMILGDSLQVMASLAEREGLRGKVQCIYIDPPYGIKFNSNFQWSTTSRDVRDGNAAHITREPEQVKAFRDTWRYGIHSYLSYLRDRLEVARDLLSDSGSVFVQIGDENVHRVRALMDEVFGADGFVSEIVAKKSGGMGQAEIDNVADFILWYSKEKSAIKYRPLFEAKELDSGAGLRYRTVQSVDGRSRPMTRGEVLEPSSLPAGSRVFLGGPLTSETASRSTVFDFELNGAVIRIRKGGWKTSQLGMSRLIKADRLFNTKTFANYKLFFSDFPAVGIPNLWQDTMGTAERNKVYVVQTVSKIVQRCILMTTDPGDLVLDPTCGSGTTAYVAEQWGRRWITIDTSRVALALARARVMGARYPYYLLADSADGQRKEAEISGQWRVDSEEQGAEVSGQWRVDSEEQEGLTTDHSPLTTNSIRQGFVYERVPHITLKSIANNAEIDVIWESWQETIGPLLEQLSAVVKPSGQWTVDSGEQENSPLSTDHSLAEWEVPRDLPDGWPPEAAALHEEFWSARVARQREIDASIAAKADFEYLYDKPYEDKRKVRVAGPFTVESLSPHRTLGVDENDELIDGLAEATGPYGEPQDFASMILENLKSAGVQQAHVEDRISFTSLTPWPGDLVCADGRYTEGGDADAGAERRAAIFIGPEFGTVSRPDLVQAAREAAESGFDVLIACAFSYEATAAELNQLGRIPVLKARMNADLHMAADLKATGKGNLFVIFGEPDIVVASEEWLVDSAGRGVAPYDILKLVSGLDSLAEINRLDSRDLRSYAALSRRREVWDYLADAAGGGVDPGEHRGGAGAPDDGGVSSVAWHCAGLAGRTRDLRDVMRTAGPDAERGLRVLVERLRGDPQDVTRADAFTHYSPLSTLHSPLTTSHWTQVTVRGVDVFHPNSGEVRSDGPDGIACWFIDTDYNEESFFVRHAYFLGQNDPYKSLKTTLKAEIDAEAWETLHSATSRPFDKPASGRIAVKVINHLGDEVMKVFRVG